MNYTKSNRVLKEENKLWPMTPVDIDESEWPRQPSHDAVRLRVLRSREFLIQVFRESGHIRISVNRTLMGKDGRWKDDISWDELQLIKSWCGFSGDTAVEIFPKSSDVVNVANMRHLWILSEPLPFGWTTPE